MAAKIREFDEDLVVFWKVQSTAMAEDTGLKIEKKGKERDDKWAWMAVRERKRKERGEDDR